MATTTITITSDDIDGSEGAESVQFGYKGKSYVIDLGPKNAEKLDKALQPFIGKARGITTPGKSVTPRLKGSTPRSTGLPEYDPAAFKTWKAANGIPSATGRPSKELVARFVQETTKA